MEGLELVSFKIISAVGTARSLYIESIQKAKEGKFSDAEALLQQGETYYTEGHHAHAELLSSYADGTEIPLDILLVHAEDQMMSAEGFRIIAEEIIALYRFISKQ